MDETLNCTLTVDEGNKKATIAGLQEVDFEMDLNADIDFTILVSMLMDKIDTLQLVNIVLAEEPADAKLKLITDTIKEIFEKYNESLIEVDEEVPSDEIPF